MDIFNRAELACKREMVLRANRGKITREYIAILPTFIAMLATCFVFFVFVSLIGSPIG